VRLGNKLRVAAVAAANMPNPKLSRFSHCTVKSSQDDIKMMSCTGKNVGTAFKFEHPPTWSYNSPRKFTMVRYHVIRTPSETADSAPNILLRGSFVPKRFQIKFKLNCNSLLSRRARRTLSTYLLGLLHNDHLSWCHNNELTIAEVGGKNASGKSVKKEKSYQKRQNRRGDDIGISGGYGPL